MKKKFFFPEVLKVITYFWFTRPGFLIKLLKQMLIIIYLIIFIFIFFCGIIIFVFNCKHLLGILLRLEFIVLSLFINLFIYLNLFNYELFFSIYFLTFRVCEGALGLSILVSLIRTHGNDYFISFTVLQC